MTEAETKRARRRRPSLCLIIVLGVFILFIFLLIGIPLIKGTLTVPMNSIAVVPVEGVIVNVSEKVEKVKKYGEDPRVKAIVVKIDSPGGTVGAVQELYSELLKVRTQKKKPVVASLGNIAASGGYYVACAADKIVTNPGTITGSVGVIMTFPNWEKLIQKLGVRMEVIKSGKFKDIGSPTRPMTPEEKELLSEVINDVYDQFFEVVYKARREGIKSALLKETRVEASDPATTPSVSEEAIKNRLRQLADGRIFSGRQALKYGLVDEEGTFHDAIEIARKLAKIKGKPHIIKPREPFRLWDVIFGRSSAISTLPLSDSPRLEYRFVIR